MCGIAGFVGAGDRSDLERMTHSMAHRGPDGSGFYIDQNLGVHIGHRRLAIRDVAGGMQPLWNVSNTICVSYNGEIYNHIELRRELEAAGHVFLSSHSDTEVIVHGWEQWGHDLALRLNGMFAFCILDLEKKCLYLARDRFGEKPLYYASHSGFFAFASELTALALHPKISTTYSQTALVKLFAYGYIPAPYALFKNTNKLPAGHAITVDLSTLNSKIERYWEFRLDPDETMASHGEERLAEELRYLLTNSVNRRLVSDVPIGLFLSGGIDSSAILASATESVGSSNINTFTIGFTERSFDESIFARYVADYHSVKHHERILDLAKARDLIPSVFSRLDEPLGDPSILPTFMLSAFTREFVGVALSGDGADELFAGYDPFDALGPAALYTRIMPPNVNSILRTLANYIPSSTRNMSFDYKLKQLLKGLSVAESAWAPAWMAPLDLAEASQLFGYKIRVEDAYSEAMNLWETGPANSRVDRLIQFFVHFYLQDNILTKVDRASMMASLETRAIFLDNDLVDFCIRLPSRFKYRKGKRKYLLKKALEPMLPKQTLNRRKKGFGIPLSGWLRQVPEILPLSPVSGMDISFVKLAWQEHRNGQKDRRLFLWTWWCLQQFAGHH